MGETASTVLLDTWTLGPYTSGTFAQVDQIDFEHLKSRICINIYCSTMSPKTLPGILLALTLLIALSSAYPHYLLEIPNSHLVPDPCRPGVYGRGFGHVSGNHRGRLTQFGRDFGQYLKWTRALCETDSDGDGLTNGQELGDPDCVWERGQNPTRNTDITNPGQDNENPNCE